MNKEYNYNPFSFKGCINRRYYILYLILINIIFHILSFIITTETVHITETYFILAVPIMTLHMFNVKKRGQDIWNNEVLSWVVAIILAVVPLCLGIIMLISSNPNMLIPFFIGLLVCIILNVPLLLRKGKNTLNKERI